MPLETVAAPARAVGLVFYLAENGSPFTLGWRAQRDLPIEDPVRANHEASLNVPRREAGRP
jgi:hypothetical protein